MASSNHHAKNSNITVVQQHQHQQSHDHKTTNNSSSITTRQIIRLFICISIYRLANAWLIRTQFDPDEYWQTLEPAYCLVFGSSSSTTADDVGIVVDGVRIDATHNDKYLYNDDDDGDGDRWIEQQEQQHGCALTWEWTRRWMPPTTATTPTQSTATSSQTESTRQNNAQQMIERALHGPVRSYVSILPTYWYYLSCSSIFRWATQNSNNEEVISDDNTISTMNNNNFQNYVKQFIRQHATHLISKGPTYLHAILIAAPTDVSVWYITFHISRANNLHHHHLGTSKSNKNYNHNAGIDWSSSWPFWALVCSITSWFHGYALVRTYANSMEAVFLLVGIALLGPELFGQTSLELESEPHRRQCCHRPQAKLAFMLGGLSACVRFTSLAAWVPIGLIITFNSGRTGIGPRSREKGTTQLSYNYRNALLHTLIGLCAVYGLIGVILGCFIDRYFYGFWAIPFLGNIHFNVLLGHGSLYGTHPLLWYAYAGIPAICGIMLPFFLWELAIASKLGSTGFWKVLRKLTPSMSQQDNQKENEYNNPRVVLLGIIAPYIILHSFSEHKEFRFLLPILPLICVLAGHAMTRLASTMNEATNNDGGDDGDYNPPLKSLIRIKGIFTSPRLLLGVTILLNYPHLFYLGLIHQRGPIAVNRFLTSAIGENVLQANQNSNSGRPQDYSIHYLMGCHSAPLFSHLHIPNVRVNAWYLDCSPDCRSNPAIVCESDAFSSDPLGFTRSAYGVSHDGDCSEEDTIRDPPSFLVAMQDDAADVDNVLTGSLGMSRVASVRHTVKSLSWHRPAHHDVSSSSGHCQSNERCHDVVTLFSLVDIHFDHMDVFFKSRS